MAIPVITPADRCGAPVSGTHTPSPNGDITERQLADQRDLAESAAQPLIEQLETHPPVVGQCPDPAVLVDLDLDRGTATVLDDSVVYATSPDGTNTVTGMAALITMRRTGAGWRAADFQSWRLSQDTA